MSSASDKGWGKARKLRAPVGVSVSWEAIIEGRTFFRYSSPPRGPKVAHPRGVSRPKATWGTAGEMKQRNAWLILALEAVVACGDTPASTSPANEANGGGAGSVAPDPVG